MSDLPERLRAEARDNFYGRPEIMHEAADEIERLERELARLERSAQGEGGGSGPWDLP